MGKAANSSISLKNIHITDNFWNKYVHLVKDVIIPYQWDILNDRLEDVETSHCIENFRIAAGEKEGEFQGAVFQDTDVAKWLEAVGFALSYERDEKLEALADETIDLIGRAQQEDGYLNTYFTIKEPDRRWSNLMEGHELYTAGHMIEAAVAYYDATGNKEALEIARGLQKVIEDRCTDEYGYLEAFNRKFEPEENDKLSENGIIAEKTMNTLLHVFEAYTELYRVTKDPFTGDRLRFMMDLFADKIYNKELGRQEVFFDRTWNSLIDLYSYGHDIETSWLMDRGLEVLDDEKYTGKITPITTEIAENIYHRAFVDHSLMNECENGVNDTRRIWWVQAETVIGFLNRYQKDPEKKEYLQAAEDEWNYIKTYMLDPRDGSEWFWYVKEDHTPGDGPIVEPWKCPYHNGRMCMEVIRRMKNAE